MLCLGLIGGCAEDGGSGPPATVQGSCFYSCNTNFGKAYGCASNPSITSSETCDTAAEMQCGSASIDTNEFEASCEACDGSCAPEWHDP